MLQINRNVDMAQNEEIGLQPMTEEMMSKLRRLTCLADHGNCTQGENRAEKIDGIFKQNEENVSRYFMCKYSFMFRVILLMN